MMQGHQLFIVVLVSHALLGAAFLLGPHGRVVRVPRLRAPAGLAMRLNQGDQLERAPLALVDPTRATIGEHSGAYQRARLGLVDVLTASSVKLWQGVFEECDVDGNGFIDRRELLVLLKRLGLPIPSDEDLKALIQQVDVDENGLLDYAEFCHLARELDPAPPKVDQTPPKRWRIAGMRSLLRQWLRERRGVVLWRNVFDSLDTLPKDGYLGVAELGAALELAGASSTTDSEVIRRLLVKYDDNDDGKLSYEEFSRMAVDIISSNVQYERALQVVSGRVSYDDAAARAERANAAAAELMLQEQADAEVRVSMQRSNSSRDESVGAHGVRDSSQASQDVLVKAAGVALVEERIKATLDRSGFANEAIGVLRVQDELFRRFKVKYSGQIELNDSLTAERVMLLDAIRSGDAATIRALTNIDWNFVYPPAMVDGESGERALEAWCRSPLCLLVRPDEGNFERSMVGVSTKERFELLEDVLASGCADPNFPPIYWGGPAVHATFEGDVSALEALRRAGCDLRQRFEWVLQDEPRFSLVHAAAFNGQVEVLKYLRQFLPPSFFRELDAEGSNPLHTLLDSSRDMETARFLLDVGVDGFSRNSLGRSPLSMAIETMPTLALELLQTKSRFEYRWWGNDLYWYSFSGIVLPLQSRADGVAVRQHTQEREAHLNQYGQMEGHPERFSSGAKGGAKGDGESVSPMLVNDESGRPVTIEELILRHDRKELLETPVMLDLIERKWQYFAAERYRTRTITFASMLLSVFTCSVTEPGTIPFYAAAAASFVSWTLFVLEQRTKLKGRPVASEPSGNSRALASTFFDALGVFELITVPTVTSFRLLEHLSLVSLSEQQVAVLASIDGVLQVSLALSMLNLVSLFRVLGPLLITVVQMLSDSVRFAIVIGIVIIGYANGFYSLIHFGVTSAYLESLNFDYSYGSIVSEMCLWLTGQPNLDLISPLSSSVQLGADLLFWSFIVTSYFVLLNLLIAIFNTTYERILSNSVAEWLFIRLKTTVEFENDNASVDGVISYYEQLQERDNQRAVRGVVAEGGLDTDSGSLSKSASTRQVGL